MYKFVNKSEIIIMYFLFIIAIINLKLEDNFVIFFLEIYNIIHTYIIL